MILAFTNVILHVSGQITKRFVFTINYHTHPFLSVKNREVSTLIFGLFFSESKNKKISVIPLTC